MTLFPNLPYVPPPRAHEAPARTQPTPRPAEQAVLLVAPKQSEEEARALALLAECRAGLDEALVAVRAWIADKEPTDANYAAGGRFFRERTRRYYDKLYPYIFTNDAEKRREMEAVADLRGVFELLCELNGGGYGHDKECLAFYQRTCKR